MYVLNSNSFILVVSSLQVRTRDTFLTAVGATHIPLETTTRIEMVHRKNRNMEQEATSVVSNPRIP